MRLVIMYMPWLNEKPYAIYYDGGSGKPQPNGERFETEEQARAWCEMRLKGVQRVAEFELPE